MLHERSICWLLAGGTRDDPPDPRRMEHLRALRDAAHERPATSFAALRADPVDCCGVA